MAELKDKTAAHEHEHTHDHDHDHNHDHNHDHDHDHDHEHEHTHDHDHDHGHDHDHDHDHEEVELDESKMDAHHIICAECDEPMDECECPPDPKGVTQKIYDIKGLDCADCASKIERGLSKIEGIEDVSVVYATEQVRIRAEQPDRFLNIVNEVADKLEPGCVVCQRERSVAKARAAKVEEKKPFLKEWFFGEAYAKHQMIIGGILFVIGLILEHFMGNEAIAIPMYFIAYFFVGAPIVLTAIRMIFKGQFFDENFLMSVATIGAFCIQEYPEAVGVMLFYRIGEYFEEMASDRSRDQIMEAADMRPEVVNLVNENGEVEVIPSENAQVGDLVIVRPGDRVPLDGIVTEGESRIDTSPVTGEPVPVKVQVGDEVVSGCVNTSGTLTVRVEKPLEESMVTRILDSVENAAATKPKMDRFITRFSRVYTPFVVVVALLTAIVPPLFFGGDWYKWIYTALSFLVISCPCALVLSVPLAYFSGIGAGSKLGILFKGGISLEALNNVKAVVMDKTGTITKGNFVVQHIVSTSGMADDELLAVCAACEKFSTHPIGESIVKAAEEKKLQIANAENVQEIAGHGIQADVGGEVVLAGNEKLMAQNNIAIPKEAVPSYGTPVYIAKAGKFAGAIIIADTIKADAKDAVSALHKNGVTTVMLTGDTEENAKAVAEQTGIAKVMAKLLPQDKLNALKKVREEVGAVMFVGDGINDAPVLAGADVGAAMGSGADAAIEAADVVFMNTDLKAVPTSIDIAKQTNRIAVMNIVFALGVKAIVMILGFMGIANMWFAVFADTGVSILCVLNSIRVLYKKRSM